MTIRTSIAAIVLLAGISGLVFFATHSEKELMWQGRPISSWASSLCSSDSSERTDATRAFESIGNDAVPSLVRMASARDPFYKSAFVGLASKLPPRSQISWYRVLKPMDARRKRLAAVLALQVLGTNAAPAVPVLRNILREDDVQLSWQAGVALGRIGRSGLSALAGSIQIEKPFFASRICDLLGSFGNQASNAVPALVAALAVQSPLLPDHAAKALASIGAPAVPSLIVALAHPEARVRQRAANALGTIGPVAMSSVSALIERASDRDASVRAASAEALGKIRSWDSRVIRALIPVLKDHDEDVRLAAIEAIQRGSSGAEPAAAAIRELLEDPNVEVRSTARAILEELSRVHDAAVRRAAIPE